MLTVTKLRRVWVAAVLPLCLTVYLAATHGQEPAAKQPTPATPPRAIQIGGPAGPTRVPDPWQQGSFTHLQNVTALDLTSDGKSVGVTTLGFRHDRNFWLLGEGGKVVEGRFVQPWAPFQVAVLPGAKAFGVGLAYSRITSPNPTMSLFEAGKADVGKPAETVLEDSWWDGGWLRYGGGDWKTGWPVSIVGDLMVRANDSALTVRGHNGSVRLRPDGKADRYPALDSSRPFRMAASGDGRRVAWGYIAPDVKGQTERTRQWLREAPGVLTVRDVEGKGQGWSAAPQARAAPAAKPPEPADDFPEMADDFNMKPQALVPFRAAVSVGLNGDGSRAAATEYGGWVRVKRDRGIGSWNPKYPVPFCPRQRGRLRVFGDRGEELAGADLPADGLFQVHLDKTGETVWCAPQAWFARGLAGRAWLPADPGADTVYLYDVRRRAWADACRFPDAVSDLAVHPDGDRALVSCWDGTTYLVGRDGAVRKRLAVGQPARVRWADDGRSAVIGTQGGEVWSVDGGGEVLWKAALPAAEMPPIKDPIKPVLPGAPIYAVGRVGQEHAYVGDIWLVKVKEGAFIVDAAGTSAVPSTWQRMRSAGVEPKTVSHALLSHTHGDHLGGAYLWRAQGVKVVAPATAAFSATWLTPTWSDYGVWPPCQIDQPLPLARVGDEAEFTVSGQRVRAVFVPGHSFDLVVYLVDFGDKRVAFTGDLGFTGQDILHRCWGDREKATLVVRAIRDKVLPFKPDYVFTGHDAQKDGTAFLENLVKRTEEALRAPPGKPE